MKGKNKDNNQSEMIIYPTEDGLAKIETTFDDDTVWMSVDQMAALFQRDRSVIGRQERNIFKEGELQKEAVWAKFARTAVDGTMKLWANTKRPVNPASPLKGRVEFNSMMEAIESGKNGVACCRPHRLLILRVRRTTNIPSRGNAWRAL